VDLTPDQIAQIVRELELHPTFSVQPEQVKSGDDWSYIGVGDNPVFQNGWSNHGSTYQDAGYRKVGNLVYLVGTMDIGTPGTAFTLPVGYRPEFKLVFIGAVSLGNAGCVVTDVCIVTVNTDGTVVINAVSSPASLHGIVFKTP